MLSRKLRIGVMRWMILWGIAILVVSAIILVGLFAGVFPSYYVIILMGVLGQYLVLNNYFYSTWKGYVEMIYGKIDDAEKVDANGVKEKFPDLFVSTEIIKDPDIRAIINTLFSYIDTMTPDDPYELCKAYNDKSLDWYIMEYINRYKQTSDIYMDYLVRTMKNHYGIKEIYAIEIADSMTAGNLLIARLNSLCYAKYLEHLKQKQDDIVKQLRLNKEINDKILKALRKIRGES